MQRPLMLILCSFLLAVPALAKDKVDKLDFNFEGNRRTYYLFVPDKEGALPLVVLLHGSGRNGLIMAEAWKGLASREHFIIAAPDSLDPAMWQSDKDSPDFIHAMVEQVSARHPVDYARVHLFGHSGGAVYGLALAILDSEYFAATAVHAGALNPQNFKLFAKARRRMPIAVWVGDQDAYFPLDMVKATTEQFEANGFPVKLTILPRHTHNYDEVSDVVNAKAWDFFKTTQLQPAKAESPE